MLAEIITIGDEILIGQIVDTNSSWISEELNKIGVTVSRITSVSDTEAQITEAVNSAMQRADAVLITGGLGPTKDDITKHTLAKIFGMKLVKDEATSAHIEKRLAELGIPFTESNRSQAMVPQGCKVLFNRNGTAPGMWFERDGKVVVSMPGVPFEMKAVMSEEALPELRKHFKLQSVIHKTAVTFGMAESLLSEKIENWEAALPKYLHLAYLPGPKGVRLRLSAYEVNGNDAQAEIDRQFGELEKIIPDIIIGYGNVSMEGVIGDLLIGGGETVSVAESCTGGNIAHRFTLIEGASDYFTGGVVSYANEVKINVLGVKKEDIEKYGAVSRTVAEQMAEGVRKITGSTYAVSTTGIAGPTGGTPEKPVGTVWMALSSPQGTFSCRMVFGPMRKENIQRASHAAMNMLRLHLVRTNLY